MLKKHGQILLSVLYINDICIALFSWMLAYFIRFRFGLFESVGAPPIVHYYYAIPFIIIIWPVVFRISKLYLPKRNVSLLKEFFSIFQGNILSVLILVSLSFFFYKEYSYSRILMAIFFLVSLFSITLSRVIIRNIMRYLRSRGYNLKHVIIVGAGDLGSKLAQKMDENRWAGFNLVGWIDDYKEIGSEMEGAKILGRCTQINRYIKERHVDQVFIALPVKAYNRLLYVLKKLEDETVDIKVVPNIYQAITLNANVEDFDGLPTINLTESPIYGWNQLIKRSADIVVSLLAITITSPLMLATAAFIKITSAGPVLFKQTRYGLNGRELTILKFRSMYVQDGKISDRIQARKDDPRVTPIGKFIRSTSIDELPQLLNVLKGEMSIVGPRPHPLYLDDEHKKLLKTYMWRYKVKPGITGWAQVNGWRGETDTLEKMKQRIEHDIYYIEHWSPMLDLKIIWLTLWKGLINKNAY